MKWQACSRITSPAAAMEVILLTGFLLGGDFDIANGTVAQWCSSFSS
jgi:hypothetical protein